MTANAKNLSTLANVLDDGTSGQILQSTGSGGVVFANIAAGASVYDSAALLPLAGNDAGDMAFVTATSHFYINNGTGWYSVNLINTDPAITSVQDASANTTPFTLSTDGSATVITITANDPENVPLTYSYAVTTGSLTNGGGTTATVTQSDNVFTVTPSTTEAYAGTFNLTFTASDGINTATSDNSFTLQFITTITNSKYTTLLATATPKNTTVYRYFKFLPQAMRSATPDAMQYSEFELTDGTSYYSPSSASQLYRADDTDGDDYVASQNVASSIDGDTSTKLFNGGWASKYYLYDMGSSFNTVLTGWRYKTANDTDSRDPISWTLLGSTNNSDWVLLDQRVNETITTSRSTATQDFTFNATNQAFFNVANSNYPITVTGDAHAGTFSPYRHGGYSLGFAGDSYITLSNSSTFELTGDFCIDGFWYLPTTNSGTIFELGQYQDGILFGPDQYDNGIYVNGSKLTGLASSVTTNTWQHFAIVRKGSGSNNFKLYIDGTKVAESTITANINSNYSSYTNIRIGSATHSSSAAFDLDDGSYIRDLRIVKGDSVYPSSGDSVPPNSITVPTEKSTAITGTILFAGSLPYLADASTTNSTFTATNTVSTKSFSPYDYLEHSATDHGGSVYFDGSGDYLQTANPLSLSGDFTVSAWVYPEGASKVQVIASPDLSPNNQFFIDANNFMGTYDGSSTNNAQGFSVTRNAWNYLVWSRSGSSLNMYLNGEQSSNSPSSTNTYNLQHIGILSGANGPMQGYISDLQVKTTSTSAANAAPPTAPLSSSGTSLHIKGTDASIIDKAQGANLKLIGNTTGSTTQVKFGSSKSMYFDGTGDYLTFPHREELNFASNDWTIECWIYPKTNVGDCGIWHQSASGTDWFSLYLDGSFNPKFVLKNNNAEEWTGTAAANTAPQNTWTHLALVRKFGTGVYLFAGGTLVASATNDTSVAMLDKTYDHVIGYERFVGSGTYFDGYIQDFRITNGLARYINALNPTTSFTPPTAPLEG